MKTTEQKIEELEKEFNQKLQALKAEIKPKFKKGDFVYSEWSNVNCVSIFSHFDSIGWLYYFFGGQNCDFNDSIGTANMRYDRIATESEKQLLLDKLHENGKDWDFDKKELVKYIPKTGDCVEFEYNGGKGYFFAENIDNDIYEFGGWIKDSAYWHHSSSKFDSKCTFRKITRETLQSKFKELGYEYNFETNTAKKIEWKPKIGEAYYKVHVNKDGASVARSMFRNDFVDNGYIETKNCHQTESEAQQLADEINETIKNFKK